jgi:hypothetical protein
MQQILNEKLLRLFTAQSRFKKTEEQKRLREDFLQLRTDFATLVEEQKKLREGFMLLREDFGKLGGRVEVVLGRMGRR